jgi:S-adenosyl-L-methionine hydrolase (adenosine-forming)
MATITLLSDFGLVDPYVAEMKGVILSANPDQKIVDVSHGIERHNIAMGSFILETALPYFPQGSIHVAVVDPGVGTKRLPLVVVCRLGILVGPDNGLLFRAAEKLGLKAAYKIDIQRFQGERISSTFHGRDIFARMGARLAAGLRTDAVGAEVKELVKLDIPSVIISDDRVTCTVLHVDSFGNVIVNLDEDNFERIDPFQANHIVIETKLARFSASIGSTYSEIPIDQFGIILGSQGYVEIVMKESSAASRLGLKPLEHLEIRFS